MGSEQKQRSQDQAVTDSEGNVFGTQAVDLPERPTSLIDEINNAQEEARKNKQSEYGDAFVWHCCEGEGACHRYLGRHDRHHGPAWTSVKVYLRDMSESQLQSLHQQLGMRPKRYADYFKEGL